MAGFQWFKREKKESNNPNYIKPKKGFRLSKRTRHVYELDVELSYNGKRIGIVPMNTRAPSRTKAMDIAEEGLKLSVVKVKRKKGK